MFVILTLSLGAFIVERMRDPIYSDLGLRIAEARTRANMTQSELADRVSVSRPSIANIEQGRQALPVHKFLQIAAALHCNPESLLKPDLSPSESCEVEAELDTPFPDSGDAFVQRVLRKTQK